MTYPSSGRKNGRSTTNGLRTAHESFSRTLFQRRGQWAVFVVSFVTLVAAVTKPPELGQKVGRDVDFAMPARENYQADILFQAEDLTLTKAKRDEAALKIFDTYRVDSERVRRQVRLLDERIQALLAQREPLEHAIRAELKKLNPAEDPAPAVARVVSEFAAELRRKEAFKEYPGPDVLAVWLTPTPASLPKAAPAHQKNEPPAEPPVPMELQYARDLARLSEDGIEYVLAQGIMRENTSARDGKTSTITIVREAPVGDQKASSDVPLTTVPIPETAEIVLTDYIAEQAKLLASRDVATSADWAKLQYAAVEMASPLLSDTLFYDQVYTEAARERARQAIEPVMRTVQPGEVMQRFGDYWTAQSISDVKTYWGALEAQRQPRFRIFLILAAHMLIVSLVLVALVRSVEYLTPWKRRHEAITNINLGLVVMNATVVLGRLVYYFEPTGFVMPTAAGAILLAILVNARIAVMVSFLAAALVSVQFGYDWRLMMVSCAMCAGGVFGMFSVRRRNDMTRAALKATVAGLIAMVAVTLAMDSPMTGPAVRRLALVLLSGGACLFIVPGVLSPLERLFKITTDIQLLEYSDLNNEVLSRLAIEVPATYSHSLMLGQLAEAAADAIGANGLLARVISYYHDIGKLRRPGYFSENQIGPNIHDELSPRLSARAIASHVMGGIEIAREYHLPKPIIDGIAEHHGTTLISFFYQKALSQQKHEVVREDDFRYPGPRPQRRETAIVMICDAVESGVRSIKNPNEERIREFVDKIVTGRLLDRQFDECDLTLKDLDTIKGTLIKRMATALHTRVPYPERKTDQPDNVVPMSGGSQ
jgi:putative nucleotidyltransferase with HDIG domain